MIQWLLLATPIALVAAATLLAIWGTDNGAWEPRASTAPAALAFGGTGTSGELPEQVPATVDTPVGELQDVGPPRELTHLIGHRVQLLVDIDTRLNDIAFWTGTPPDDFLVVVSRETRPGSELGSRSEAPFGAVSGGEYMIVSGVIAPVPYPEAMFSWGLTRRDAALLEERGVYVHVDRVVSRAPHITRKPTAEAADEWGRETAPPPGEQIETGLPPPRP